MAHDDLNVLSAFLAVAEERSVSECEGTAVGPRVAAKTVVGPKLGQFVRGYSGVELEMTTDDSGVDLVSAGYDAGIQLFLDQPSRRQQPAIAALVETLRLENPRK